MSESDDMLCIDLMDPDVLKDFSSMFIGAISKQYAKLHKGHNWRGCSWIRISSYQTTPDDEFAAYFDYNEKLMLTDPIWYQKFK